MRVPAAEADAVYSLGVRPIHDLDYGSFRWLVVDDAALARIEAGGVPFTEAEGAMTVQVQGFVFDPILDGEPAIPADLRASGDRPGLQLLQLVGPVRDEWISELADAGIQLLQYYPHNAYLVWADPATMADLEGLSFVRWQGPVHPAYKINSSLEGRGGNISNVEVMFYDGGKLVDVLEDFEKLGAVVLDHYPAQPDRAFHDAIIEVNASDLEDTARMTHVLWLGYSSPQPILDKIFRVVATVAGVYVLAVIVLMVFQLYSESHLIWEHEGLGFVTGSEWNAVEGREAFGAAPYIMGTLVTAALAMAMGVPISIGIAMFIPQAPKFIAGPLSVIIDLLAAVPSIIYGFWGLLVFRDFLINNIEYPLHDTFGESIWLFSSAPFGLDIFSASIILAIMIIPTTALLPIGGNIAELSTEIGKALDRYADAQDSERGLASEETRRLLVTLAMKGNQLRKYLHDCEDTDEYTRSSRIQLISLKADAILPLELCYEGPAPNQSAQVCPHAAEALRQPTGTCGAQCRGPTSEIVCPLAFWALSKQVERHLHDRTVQVAMGGVEYGALRDEETQRRKQLSLGRRPA